MTSSPDLTLMVITGGNAHGFSAWQRKRDAEREPACEHELEGLSGKDFGRETPGLSSCISKHELPALRIVPSLWGSVFLDGK